jgi:hypothetical protein
VDVLDRDEADEVRMGLVVLEGEFDEPADRLGGRQIAEVEVGLDLADVGIGYYFGGKEGLYLAVLEKAYADIRQVEADLDLGNLAPGVDPRTAESEGGELFRRDRQDVGPGPLGVLGAGSG